MVVVDGDDGVLGLLLVDPPGLFAVPGAGGVLAPTTLWPLSTIGLLLEMTARARAFISPLLPVVALATLVAHTLKSRSIYRV